MSCQQLIMFKLHLFIAVLFFNRTFSVTMPKNDYVSKMFKIFNNYTFSLKSPLITKTK